jgi:HEAT repeat protein
VRELYNVLVTDSSSARDVRVACLISLGLVHLQTIEAEATDDEVAIQPWESRQALINALVAYMQDEDNNYLVRAHAPVSLVRQLEGLPAEKHKELKEVVGEALLEMLGKRSKEENDMLRSSALAFGLLGDNDQDKLDRQIRELLIDTPDNHSDVQTEYFSYIALAKATGRMGSGDYKVEEAIAPVRKHLAKGLQGGKVDRRTWIALAIGVLGDELSQSDLLGLLNMSNELRLTLDEAKNPNEVGAMAIASGILGDLESARLLREKLGEIQDDEARGYLCLGLGLLGDSEAVEMIQKVVKDSKYRPELLRQAAIALGLLGDKQLVDELIVMLQDSTSLATQASLSAALGFIGDSRSVDPLVDMLQDDEITERARGFAAAALGIVADREPLPWNTRISVDLNYRAATETLNDNQGGTGIVNIL